MVVKMPFGVEPIITSVPSCPFQTGTNRSWEVPQQERFPTEVSHKLLQYAIELCGMSVEAT